MAERNKQNKKDDIKIGITDRKVIPQENDVRKRYSELIFHNQEYQNAHNSYEAELREMESIENGDMEMLENCWKATQTRLSNESVFFGTLAKDWSRNVKNLCIAVITLASRAAIRGGLQPEEAFSLVDCYVQELEECSDIGLLGQLALRAERHFTQLVHERREGTPDAHKNQESPHVNRCKDYIFAHLHEKLTVQEIADALFLNPNYLSDLFKKQEGQTILQYILREKIRLAQNMLVYSDYTYSEIATYLGFSSQSHMGTQFKKFTGMTLREYRNKYHIQDAPFS